MKSKSKKRFCKSGRCPASETLLAFHNDEISLIEMRGVAAHLRKCEFCSAELHFLISCPPLEANCGKAEDIPPALLELAEALLGGKQKEYRLLYELLNGKEFLMLKNA